MVEVQDIPLQHKETLLYCESVKHWSRLSREVVESPQSLKISKTQLDATLGNLLWLSLLGQGLNTIKGQRSQVWLSYFVNLGKREFSFVILKASTVKSVHVCLFQVTENRDGDGAMEGIQQTVQSFLTCFGFMGVCAFQRGCVEPGLPLLCSQSFKIAL